MKVKLDLHVHSDGSEDGRHSISTLAEAAASAGISAIAVCDHNRCTSLPENSDVLLIPGTEVSTNMGHILGLFLTRPLDYEKLRRDGLPTGSAAVREIHACGGIAVLAHPFERADARAGADAEALERLSECGLDLIETANSRAPMKVRDANQKAAALALRMGLGAVGGSDAHSAEELGNCYTVVEVDELTVGSIQAALRTQRCEAVFVRECSWKRKALSQWAKARRSGKLKTIIKALVYLAVSPFRDLLKGKS